MKETSRISRETRNEKRGLNNVVCWSRTEHDFFVQTWGKVESFISSLLKFLRKVEGRMLKWWKDIYLCPFSSICRNLLDPAFTFRTLCIRKSVTGRFLTSCLHTSHVLLPLILNHFKAHSWWANASSPLQLHSIFSVSPPSHSSTRQIRQTASSSGISSPPCSLSSERKDYIKTVASLTLPPFQFVCPFQKERLFPFSAAI